MDQVLHGSATTTEAIRRAIQHSQASLRSLAKRYGINQKTVAKWKRRSSVVDLPTGQVSDRNVGKPSSSRSRLGQNRQQFGRVGASNVRSRAEISDEKRTRCNVIQ
jgi:hypothetical protein